MIQSTQTQINAENNYLVAEGNSNQNIVHVQNTEPNENVLINYSYDIGKIIDLGPSQILNLPDEEKYLYLKETWSPPRNYKLPCSEQQEGQRLERRHLNLGHINSFPWLAFSHMHQGLFCKYCVIFCSVKEKFSLKGLVTIPVTKFAKLTGKDGILQSHNDNKYHKNASISGQSFLKMYKNPSLDIRNEISSKRLEQIKENRARLIPSIKTIKLLGRQNIPFRGHRDDGLFFPTETECESSVTSNEGNFRELLKYRIDAGDKILETHLKTCSSKATYISKTTQNELIESCGTEILVTIKNRIFSSKYYCILFDETTDLSHTSQMSLVVRYLYDNNIYEDFIGFINCHTAAYPADVNEIENFDPVMRGKVIGQTALKLLKSVQLNPSLCVGIGTDGCEVMVSEQVGAVQEIKKKTLVAERCACFNHMLNLSVSKSSQVQAIRNLVGSIKEIVASFNASPKRQFILKSTLKHHIEGLCETRWTERHDSVLRFKNDFKKIVEGLDKISAWRESASSRKASLYKIAILNFEFIVALFCLSELLSITQPLSVIFQKKNLDKTQATDILTSTLHALMEKRSLSENNFNKLWEQIEEYSDDLGIHPQMPRLP
ncbi:unnamed protein product [Ceutorhynchus assimilis]|uniref:DUF4371 domain-containing protein n=1 Tax=Ceutorhynchus assimilis TaxID=467358 RepID=A0A9N9MWF4_9CUCU|nr:unnamed protein product [Ceutorhynchus assimilis]